MSSLDKNFMSRLLAFIFHAIRNDFDGFLDKNCSTFDNNIEHKLEYTILFNEYEEMMEEKLVEFRKTEGIESNRELFDRIAEYIIDDEKNRRIVEVTLAATDYEKFVRLMKLRAKRLCHAKFVAPRKDYSIDVDIDSSKLGKRVEEGKVESPTSKSEGKYVEVKEEENLSYSSSPKHKK